MNVFVVSIEAKLVCKRGDFEVKQKKDDDAPGH